MHDEKCTRESIQRFDCSFTTRVSIDDRSIRNYYLFSSNLIYKRVIHIYAQRYTNKVSFRAIWRTILHELTLNNNENSSLEIQNVELFEYGRVTLRTALRLSIQQRDTFIYRTSLIVLKSYNIERTKISRVPSSLNFISVNNPTTTI